MNNEDWIIGPLPCPSVQQERGNKLSHGPIRMEGQQVRHQEEEHLSRFTLEDDLSPEL